MTKLPLFAAAASLLALAACQQQPTVVSSTDPDPMAKVLANAKPVELPPAISATVAFRCKDNSLATVNFFTGDKLATVQVAKDGPVTRLTAEKAGDSYKADGGWELKGDPKKVMLKQPGKDEMTCHV